MVKCPYCKENVDRTEFEVSKRCLCCGKSLATDKKVVNYFIQLADKERVEKEYAAMLGKYGKTSAAAKKEKSETSSEPEPANTGQETSSKTDSTVDYTNRETSTTATTPAKEDNHTPPLISLEDFFEDDDEMEEEKSVSAPSFDNVSDSREETAEGTPLFDSSANMGTFSDNEDTIPDLDSFFRNNPDDVVETQDEYSKTVQTDNPVEITPDVRKSEPLYSAVETQSPILGKEEFKEAFKSIQEDDICIICANVSNVKQVHTDYGKKYADTLVNDFAKILVSVFHENAFHIGSDDFIILLPGTGRKIAERDIDKVIALCEENTRNNEYGIECKATFGYIIGTGDMTKENLIVAAKEALAANKSLPKKEETKEFPFTASIRNKLTKASNPVSTSEKPSIPKGMDEKRESPLKATDTVGIEPSLNDTLNTKNMSPAERLRAKMSEKENVPVQEVSEEKLEVADMEFDFNKDGYYNDTVPDVPNEPDKLMYKTVIKVIVTIVALFFLTGFFIWYA